MKSVSKNKFLTCFRPVVDLDTMLDESEAVKKHETQNPANNNSIFSGRNGSKLIETHVVDQPPKQTLSKVIKAVLFQTILNARAQKKKRYSQNCFGSKRNYSLHTRTSSSSFKTNIDETKAIESSLSSSSSSPCSPVSESKSLSKSNECELEKQKKFQCLGIYMMILISLVVTVFCGKINVIILTLMFFCCFSLWNTSSNWLKKVGICCENTTSIAQKYSHT